MHAKTKQKFCSISSLRADGKLIEGGSSGLPCIWPEFINCKDCIFKAGRSGHDLKYLHGNTKKRFIAWSVCNLPTFQLRIKCVSLLDTYVCHLVLHYHIN